MLFTDWVASTELRVRLGEEDAETLRRDHDTMLGEAISANGGTVVKGLGDGVLATFESAADAASAAIAIQQAVDRHSRHNPDRSFGVRVGISLGDVSLEDGDVFGVAVVEASRLCAAATGGEILVADLVRSLSRGRGGFGFDPLGDLELRGLPEPVPACRLRWEPLAPDERGGRIDRSAVSSPSRHRDHRLCGSCRAPGPSGRTSPRRADGRRLHGGAVGRARGGQDPYRDRGSPGRLRGGGRRSLRAL